MYYECNTSVIRDITENYKRYLLLCACALNIKLLTFDRINSCYVCVCVGFVSGFVVYRKMAEADFVLEAETALNLKIPSTVKNMLIINGYENETIIATITESVIDEMETFAKNELHQILKHEDLEKYYGSFANKPSLFKFVSGHRKILLLISKFYSDKINKKPAKKPSIKIFENKSKLQQLEQGEMAHSKINITEENTLILRNLKSWAKDKVNKEKWDEFQLNLDNITANTLCTTEGDLYCNLKCFCNALYKIPKLSRTDCGAKRWICSNFQNHLLKKHIELPTTKHSNSMKNNLITSYISRKSQNEQINKPKINIL